MTIPPVTNYPGSLMPYITGYNPSKDDIMQYADMAIAAALRRIHERIDAYGKPTVFDIYLDTGMIPIRDLSWCANQMQKIGYKIMPKPKPIRSLS